MTWVERIRVLHIAAGFTALALFWLPMVARKGGRVHRRAGWVYVVAMGVVAATAVVVCGARILFDGPEVRARSVFLLFISILAATAAASGVRALREKQRAASTRKIINLGLPTLLLVSSVAISLYGLHLGALVFTVFGAIGLVSSGSQLFYWLRPPQSRMHWWFAHERNGRVVDRNADRLRGRQRTQAWHCKLLDPTVGRARRGRGYRPQLLDSLLQAEVCDAKARESSGGMSFNRLAGYGAPI